MLSSCLTLLSDLFVLYLISLKGNGTAVRSHEDDDKTTYYLFSNFIYVVPISFSLCNLVKNISLKH